MVPDNQASDSEPRHVVYVLGVNCEPTHFLEIVGPDEDIGDVTERWWRAFESGEKEQPGDYRGISHRPVVGFETWPDGERAQGTEVGNYE